jgi:anti-sigma factor RsiW
MAHDREVAGLRCMQVLDVLPEVIDGTLPADARRRVEDHLRGCDWCERFGGEYGAAIASLRRELGAPSMPEPVRSRLRERLRRETSPGRSGSDGPG